MDVGGERGPMRRDVVSFTFMVTWRSKAVCSLQRRIPM